MSTPHDAPSTVPPGGPGPLDPAPRPAGSSASLWGRWGPILALAAVLALVAGAWMLDQAAPQKPNLMDKRWHAPVRTVWDLSMARTAIALLGFATASSALGLLLHGLVARARRDAAAWILVFTGGAATLALLHALSSAPVR